MRCATAVCHTAPTPPPAQARCCTPAAGWPLQRQQHLHGALAQLRAEHYLTAVAQHKPGRKQHGEGACAGLVGVAGAVSRTDLQQQRSGEHIVDVERVRTQWVQHAVVHAVLVLLGGECPGS